MSNPIKEDRTMSKAEFKEFLEETNLEEFNRRIKAIENQIVIMINRINEISLWVKNETE